MPWIHVWTWTATKNGLRSSPSSLEHPRRRVDEQLERSETAGGVAVAEIDLVGEQDAVLAGVLEGVRDVGVAHRPKGDERVVAAVVRRAQLLEERRPAVLDCGADEFDVVVEVTVDGGRGHACPPGHGAQ